MIDLTELIVDCFKPFKALLFYTDGQDQYYIESYDIGTKGNPINAHPLSLKESQAVADALDHSAELKADYLHGKGLFPENLLYLSQEKNGFAMWHTPKQKVNLFFKADLGITDGVAEVPPMLWKADSDSLQVFALKKNTRPNTQTPLYHAPFFNIYDDGRVCMGNVRIQIPNGCSLMEFITLWENYFFESTFTHELMGGAVKGDKLIQIWQQQRNGQTTFPTARLIRTNTTLKQLIQ